MKSAKQGGTHENSRKDSVDAGCDLPTGECGWIHRRVPKDFPAAAPGSQQAVNSYGISGTFASAPVDEAIDIPTRMSLPIATCVLAWERMAADTQRSHVKARPQD
jgi:hypothetical protein